MGEPFELEVFADAVGEIFVVEAGSEAGAARLTLELIEASPRGEAVFAAIFRGPAEPILAQGTYRFERTDRDAIEIFIVPIASDERGSTYEAIFA